MMQSLPKKTWNWLPAVSVVALTTTILAWSYWQTFAELIEEWSKNPLYSHGYLVPVFAVGLLWVRRDLLPKLPLAPSWWALIFLGVAGAMRLGAGYFYFTWPDRSSLLVSIFAAALAVGGWAAVRWVWPSILFLVFMIPFPGVMEDNLIRPLQRIATLASTNVLQTFGLFAQADGNVIVLSDVEMGVVEACSGLRMLSVFMALTVGTYFVLQRPIWQKVVIALSAFPIAVFCNVVRISVTGVLYEVADREFAQFIFHDVAGWLMMPLALFLLLLELKFLDFIFTIDLPQVKMEPLVAPHTRAIPLASQGTFRA